MFVVMKWQLQIMIAIAFVIIFLKLCVIRNTFWSEINNYWTHSLKSNKQWVWISCTGHGHIEF